MSGGIGSIAGTMLGAATGIPGGAQLGGALGGAIGGGIGGGKGTPATQNTQASLPSWLSSPYQQSITDATSLYNSQNYNPDFAYQVAPFNTTQNNAFGAINGIQGQYQQPFNQAIQGTGNLGNQAAGGLNNAQFQSYMNPYIQNVLDTSGQQQFRNFDQANQGMMAKAAGSGAFGNSRLGLAQGQMGSNFLMDMGAQQAQTLSNGFNTALGGYQRGIDQGLQAYGQLGNLAQGRQQTGLQGMNAQLAIGNQQQQLSQQQLTADQQSALGEANYGWDQLSRYQNAIGNPASMYGAHSSTQTPQTAPGWQQGLGLASQMNGMGATSAIQGLFGGNNLSSMYGNYQNSQMASNPFGSTADSAWADAYGYKTGGKVRGYAKGGLVNPTTLQHGTRSGGLLHKGYAQGGQVPMRREYGIAGCYADGGTVDPVSVALTDSTQLDTLGSKIAIERAHQYVNQMLGNVTNPYEGLRSGGIVGYAKGGDVDPVKQAFAAYIAGSAIGADGLPINNDTTAMMNDLSKRYPGGGLLPDVNQYSGSTNMPNLPRPAYNGYYRQHSDEALDRQMLGQELRRGGIVGYDEGGSIFDMWSKPAQEWNVPKGHFYDGWGDVIGNGMNSLANMGDPTAAMQAMQGFGNTASALANSDTPDTADQTPMSRFAAHMGNLQSLPYKAMLAPGNAISGAVENLTTPYSDKQKAKEAKTKMAGLKDKAAVQDAQIEQVGLDKADSDYIEALHSMANNTETQLSSAPQGQQGPMGPFGTPMNMSALAFGSSLLANGGGLQYQALGKAGQDLYEGTLKQKQAEAMANYRSAEAQAALGNLGVKQQMAPYTQQLKAAQANNAAQNPYIQAQRTISARASKILEDAVLSGHIYDPTAAMTQAQQEYFSGQLGGAQAGMMGLQPTSIGGAGQQGVSISSKEEWESLPKGTPFTFNGKPGVKQ